MSDAYLFGFVVIIAFFWGGAWLIALAIPAITQGGLFATGVTIVWLGASSMVDWLAKGQ